MTRPFADFLHEQSAGRTHTELTDALTEVVAAVQDTGKKGTLTLTITVAPLDKTGTALTVTDQIKKSVPQHDRQKSIFYANDGSLTRENPLQPTFEGLREVPAIQDPIALKENRA